jgi:hypothetical protein
MNLSNTFRTENLTSKIKLKAMIMGILITAAVLVASNTNEPAIAQDGSNDIVGCAHTVKVTISDLPKQTSDATVFVPIFNTDPNDDRGDGNITIPGIGSAHVVVNFHLAVRGSYDMEISNIPGQTEIADTALTESEVCRTALTSNNLPSDLAIPGVGNGFIELTEPEPGEFH